MRWDVIRGVCGSIESSVIGECVMDKGCGSDWVVRNIMEVFGVICGEGVGGWYVVKSSGMCGVLGGDSRAWGEARVM